ncbi:hypothetical protein Kpol_367p1 [Vanderwaltozyma polyspora DSM 70294]|uniref:Endoplasmic reticulum-Golgi intermediate compartment protein n=1 Tax=Vanderwaltozyma polyspora (strain ATCC 22028 / DSM 70294 / BCRC 21397 / CBS 2163 / NBRC 10782 / NRRL Y-8283 / UCD 57-17) TaxID=436907 RepID=A7TRQ2_VANPO|nr:uncharacterized protein Kpol_367p1 [Vanderwaltozyma polyspora DSM 70294]EDO15046.1 hypothetical protein Kpol_367p1 [Vanderwaltozyma polyspora DSM 70294]
MKRNSILAYDVFTKTEEDVRIRTRVGGIITLCCLSFTAILLFSEWINFNHVITKPNLVIDREHHLKLELNIDITFPFIPCQLLNLDIMDDSGNVQLDITESGFTKTRIGSDGQQLGTTNFKVSEDLLEYSPKDKNYCGSCYGARDQSKNDEAESVDKKVCCQTCEDVKNAYSDAGWAFFDGKNIEQCEREGYVEKMNDQLNEGCRISGEALLNRIHGNIHFAPGKAFQNRGGHFHDTSFYNDHKNLNFKHMIEHLSFGRPVAQFKSNKDLVAMTSPLDGHQELPSIDAHNHQFIYFAKIVPTRFEYLNKQAQETSQLVVTSHMKPIGDATDYSTTMNSRQGIPGLFIDYEISPLKVINREQHATTWSGFLLNCITSIGGILAVGTVADKIVHATQRVVSHINNK